MLENRQQIRITDDAYAYLCKYGSLSYIATRLLIELKEDVIGLPNLRPTAQHLVKTNITILERASSYIDFINNLQKVYSRDYVTFSFSRLLEWAAQTDYLDKHGWPILTDPGLRESMALLYSQDDKNISTLLCEINKLLPGVK